MGSQYKNQTRYKGNRSQKQGDKKRKGQKSSVFKGGISDMNGNVFQCHGEANVSNQFNRTMEALETYVSANFNDRIQLHLRHVLKYMEKPEVMRPNQPTDPNDLYMMEIWKKEIDAYVRLKELLEHSMGKLYVTVWSQCSKAMRSKIRGTTGFVSMDKNLDVIQLLKIIKGVTMHFDSQTYAPKSLDDAKKLFYNMKQGEHEKHPAFFKRFCNHVEVIEHYGGELGSDPVLLRLEQNFLEQQGKWPIKSGGIKADPDNPQPDEVRADIEYETSVLKKLARDRYLAIAYLTRCDQERVGEYVIDLHNDYVGGENRHPTTLTSAYNAVINY